MYQTKIQKQYCQQFFTRLDETNKIQIDLKKIKAHLYSQKSQAKQVILGIKKAYLNVFHYKADLNVLHYDLYVKNFKIVDKRGTIETNTIFYDDKNNKINDLFYIDTPIKLQAPGFEENRTLTTSGVKIPLTNRNHLFIQNSALAGSVYLLPLNLLSIQRNMDEDEEIDQSQSISIKENEIIIDITKTDQHELEIEMEIDALFWQDNTVLVGQPYPRVDYKIIYGLKSQTKIIIDFQTTQHYIIQPEIEIYVQTF